MKDRQATQQALSKVPAVTLGFWIIKILATTLGETGGDTVTMTWLGETTRIRCPRLSDRHGDIRRAADRAGLGADQGARVQPVALLGDDRRLDHVRDDAGGLRRPLARHRLSRRLAAALRLRAAVAVRLVPDAGHGRRQHASPAARRDILLDHDHLFADARDRARRLDRRLAGSAIRAARWCSARRLRFSPSLYFTTRVSRVALFWAAFILTRPLGATVGDFLDKPLGKGGLELSRPLASAVLAIVIVAADPDPAAAARQASRR